MARYLPDSILDLPLIDIAESGDELYICVGQPDDYADITNHEKGMTNLTPGAESADSASDYVIGDGDSSGRKLTILAQSITPTADADIDHVVVADSVAQEIKATTIASFSVKNGVAKAIPEFDLVEILDPA